MASSTISCSNPNSRQRKHFPLERRPRMLKDFLLDDTNLCSSNGFKSFTRKACQDSSIRNLIQIDLNSDHAKQKYAQRLQRSRSKAASTTISAFRTMINAVKSIHFASVKSPSILPRSLSRKLSKRNSQLNVENKESEIKITVRVKDIVRWKSFRDLVEEKSRPSDLSSSPHHCTTTTTKGSTCTPCSSNGSSWCDSDFNSEYLPSEEYGENEPDVCKKNLPCVGKDPMETTTDITANTAVGPEQGRKYASEEKEQHSPRSVLDFEYKENEDSFFSFNESLAIMERTKQKLMENIQRLESLAKLEPHNIEKWMSLEDDEVEEEEETNEVEEKARQLLNRVKETSPLRSYKNVCTDKLLLDLFREETATKWNQTRNEELECDMARLAKAWIDGELNETVKWGVGEKKRLVLEIWTGKEGGASFRKSKKSWPGKSRVG
ncbi:hypothetical protein CRYUN_Cryun23aG0143800 [Craigia yunnanensis]